VITVLLLLPALTSLTLQIAGFTRKGHTNALFTNATPLPVILPQNGRQISQVTLDLGRYGRHVLNRDTSDMVMIVDDADVSVATMQLSEDGLTHICLQISDICAGSDDRYQNMTIDLRPGGVIVAADVRVLTGAIRQRVGVVLRLDEEARQLVVEGVDVDGILYDVPPNNIGDLVQDAERIGNEILRTVTIAVSSRAYILSQVFIDENALWLVLHS